VSASPGLGPVLIDNLLRNAVAYADTWIVVRADARGLEIENDVREQPRGSSSTGYGLQIVSRICERQGWAFAHGGQGGRFTARVAFPAASTGADRDGHGALGLQRSALDWRVHPETPPAAGQRQGSA
jgi:hypothetical protein